MGDWKRTTLFGVPISPKVRWVFWIVFSTCYATVTLILLKAVRNDGSVEVEFVRSMTHPLALLVAGAVTWGLCRVAGFTLKSQKESFLEMEVGGTAPASSELRSYVTQDTFRVFAGLFLSFAVLMIPIEIFVRSRVKTPTPFWPFLFGALAMAGVFWWVSHFFRAGKFMARADEEGVEIQDLSQRNKRIHLKWSEIASGVRVENFSVMGSNSYIEFRNVVGKAKAKVFIGVAPLPQQREFVQVVARHLSRSSAA